MKQEMSKAERKAQTKSMEIEGRKGDREYRIQKLEKKQPGGE